MNIGTLVETLRVSSTRVDLKLITLFQRPNAAAEREIAALPHYVRPMITGERLSLSRARNVILTDIAKRGGFDSKSLVLFPDDDCWFTDVYLPIMDMMFAEDDDLQYWFCRYSSCPAADTALFARTRPARASDVVRRSSSITMVVRASLMEKLGPFSEELGVGTSLNGGEDTDFAVRLYRSGRKGAACNHALVGHRDWNAANRARYFAGSATVLARNAWSRPALGWEYVRKLASGASLVARRKLPLSDFGHGLTALPWPGTRPDAPAATFQQER